MTATINREDFDFVQQLVRSRSAIVLEAGKEYLLDARLGPLARASGLGSVAALVADIRSQRRGDLAEAVVEAMTTNETSFFRDVTPFQVLEKELLPAMLDARRRTRRLRIWCGACSSGQEPYSIAMMLLEAFPELEGWEVTIEATDINRKMIERTNDGTYSQLEVNRGLRAPLLLRYFDRKGIKFRVKPKLQAMVAARYMNLVEPWGARGPYDLVFLRNVLIYFDAETKRQVLDRLARVLDPSGYLFLGGAETTVGVHERFERTPYAKASCYRLKDTSK
jgi:chemotaxis protein methyltransferase CheR